MGRVYHRIAWDSDKNLGEAYNREMRLLLNDDDYCCFIDGDATWLHPFFGRQIEDVVEEHPECGVFTATTNRVACKWQLAEGGWMSDDMKYHRLIAERAYDRHYDEVEDVTDKPRGSVMSGVVILIRKSTWKRVGGFADGMLGVDNKLHWACQKHGEKVYLMKGVYVYHWYRGGNQKDKSHLL